MDHSAHTAEHQNHGQLNPWLLGCMGAIGALSLAPYILPLLGVGKLTSAGQLMGLIGGRPELTGFGTGWAGNVQEMIAAIPGIGGALTSTAPVALPGLGMSVAAGTLATLAATATLGIGGMLVANWLEKREQPGQFPWSKVVRYGALITSALIALPSILGAVSIGITFLAFLIRPLTGFQTAATMAQTLGAPSMASGGAMTGLAAILPHFISCGLPMLPVGLAMWMGKKPQPTQMPIDAQVDLVSAAPMAKGQPSELAFRITDGHGRALGPEALDTTFTQKLHMMVVDESLTDYHHIHPEYDAANGLFRCQVTPNIANRYMAWCDFTPTGAAAPIHKRLDLPVAPGSYAIPPRIVPSSSSTAGGLTITLEANPPLKAGRDSVLRVQVTDAMGQPVDGLEPIMGAYGHLAGFSADGQHFIHSHPLTPIEQPLVNGQLEFHLSPDHSGMTQFFLQLRHQGREMTLPFGQPVQAAERFASRVEAARLQPRHQHAMA